MAGDVDGGEVDFSSFVQKPGIALGGGGIDGANACAVVHADLAGVAGDGFLFVVDEGGEVSDIVFGGVAAVVYRDGADQIREGVDALAELEPFGGLLGISVGIERGILGDQGHFALPQIGERAVFLDDGLAALDVGVAIENRGGGEVGHEVGGGAGPFAEGMLAVDVEKGEAWIVFVLIAGRSEPIAAGDSGEGLVGGGEKGAFVLEIHGADPGGFGDHHWVASHLLEIGGEIPGIEDGRVIGEAVAGVDTPAGVFTVVNAGEIFVHREDIIRGVGVVLDIVEADRIGGDPVGSVDKLLAIKIVAIETGDVGEELALGFGEELELVVEPTGEAAVLGASPEAYREDGDVARFELIAGDGGVFPCVAGVVEGAIFRGEPRGKFSAEELFLLGFHSIDGPEEKPVFVLDFDDCDGGVGGEGDAGVGIILRVEFSDPGFVALLQSGVEEEESPEIAVAGVAVDSPFGGGAVGGPVGGDGDVDSLVFESGDGLPDGFDFLVVGIGDGGGVGIGGDLGVDADHVDAELGEEACVVGELLGVLVKFSGAASPESDGGVVAAEELAVGGEVDESGLAGDGFVHAAEVEEGRGFEIVMGVDERPVGARGLSDEEKAEESDEGLAMHDRPIVSAGGCMVGQFEIRFPREQAPWALVARE